MEDGPLQNDIDQQAMKLTSTRSRRTELIDERSLLPVTNPTRAGRFLRHAQPVHTRHSRYNKLKGEGDIYESSTTTVCRPLASLSLTLTAWT